MTEQQQQQQSTSSDEGSESDRDSSSDCAPRIHRDESLQTSSSPTDTMMEISSDSPMPPAIIKTSSCVEEDETCAEASMLGLDDESFFAVNKQRSRRYCTSAVKFLALALSLWFIQYFLTASLDRFGVVDGRFDFDPAVVAQQILPQLNETWTNYYFQLNETLQNTYQSRKKERPGYQLAQEGAHAVYPVVMIPGFVTSGLEVWTGRECAKKYFRQRIWGSLDSARALFTDKNCWLEHVALDPFTGMDPEGIRLRASEGFYAADYFMANYWVWERVIENLADLGYNPSTMAVEPYDWRLAFPLLEERDGYLTKLQYKIEAMHKSTGKKVVMTSHSMGAQLVHYFMKWVTTPKNQGGGGGGKKWVDKHVHAYVNIAGSHLGVPKAASALLSGEMRDTIIMGKIGAMAEQWFGRKLRKDLWSTWGSLFGMLPKGGDRIWSTGADICHNVEDEEDPICKYLSTGEKDDSEVPLILLEPEVGPAEDTVSNERNDSGECCVETDATSTLPFPGNHDTGDEHEEPETLHSMCGIDDEEQAINATVARFASKYTHTSNELLDFLTHYGAGLGQRLHSAKLYSRSADKKHRKGKDMDWLDPTKTPLPHAPNLKIYCLYGVGLNTERSYFYRVNREGTAAQKDQTGKEETYNLELPFVLDTSMDDPERNMQHGIKYTDGDGSVPLLSLGYTCHDVWRRKNSGMNPSGSKVVTVEYHNRATFSVDDPMRGGPYSADHVDILGNVEMTEDFLRVVADFEPRTESRIVSNLEEIAQEINAHPSGGVFKRKHNRKRS